MNSGATLVLSGGDYFLGDLTINASATVTAAASTRVYVKHEIIFRSRFRTPTGLTQPVYLGFAGTSTTMEAPFDGTLLAPSALVTFGTGSGLTYTGSFRAREMRVRPARTLVCKEN
ncbi:MAG TPA: hypothetical protein VJ801_12675 [Polyangia bacterium]|nr:hypothetical protein [Polyangia bacterium]